MKIGSFLSAVESFAPGLLNSLDSIHIPHVKQYEPWSKINLSKSERKEKTPEEINALRKLYWEKQQYNKFLGKQ